jgi:hypothetical protein
MRARSTLTDDEADRTHPETTNMRNYPSLPGDQQGRVGYILLWLLGVPIPILFLIYLLRGCT